MHAAALRYFEAVARAGSVRQASDTLNVAASAVDRQILKLEDDLGVQLFERLPRGMRLTAAGELLLRHVRDTLHDFDRLKGEIDQIKGIRSGRVRIACLDSLMVHFIPETIIAFHKSHPGVSLAVSGGSHAMISQRLADAESDIGITFNLPSAPDLEFFGDVRMPIVAMVGHGHPLAGRASVSMSECTRYPLLLQEDTWPIRSLLDVELKALQELARPLVVANSLLAMKPLIADGIGIAFYTPAGFLDELQRGDIVAVPIDHEAFQQLRIGLMLHRRRKPTPAAAAALELLRKQLVRLADQVERFVAVRRKQRTVSSRDATRRRAVPPKKPSHNSTKRAKA